MLEFIARVPYQAWNGWGTWPWPGTAWRSALVRRIFDRIIETRAEQDNEQWHLLILQDLVQRRGLRQSSMMHRLAPWLIAFFYYHVTWLTFLSGRSGATGSTWTSRITPSTRHAPRRPAPRTGDRGGPGKLTRPSTAGTVGRRAARQIGHDERVHKLDSLVNMAAPRLHQVLLLSWLRRGFGPKPRRWPCPEAPECSAECLVPHQVPGGPRSGPDPCRPIGWKREPPPSRSAAACAGPARRTCVGRAGRRGRHRAAAAARSASPGADVAPRPPRPPRSRAGRWRAAVPVSRLSCTETTRPRL